MAAPNDENAVPFVADANQEESGERRDVRWSSREFQQFIFDRLGNRDYDCFEYNEHEHLKEKIGFAKFGYPLSETGYDENQMKSIEETFAQIREYNNTYCEWNDQVIVSFIYNSLESLHVENENASETQDDSNADTIPHNILQTEETKSQAQVPIYVVRKCIGSTNPCRIFIDDDNRVYNSWKEYINDNKINECKMVLPKEGRYQGDAEGNVLLENHLSPACGIGRAVVKYTDIASSVAGLASGVVFGVAMIPAVAMAPVALVAAGVTSVGVGIYSIARGAATIHDRHVHGVSMSVTNAEARGAYINTVAGSLGVVGAGATMAVSKLVTNGATISQGARGVINTVNGLTIAASGVGIANSSYQIYDDWANRDQRPSLLTVFQLSSSILFFGNAIYNFRTVGTIIEESQLKALDDHQQSLRSNRHRKMFSKMVKETTRVNQGDVNVARAEVISAIKNMRNKDEIYATLTANNKLFNEKGIRFSARNGKITLNGVSVDLSSFGAMEKGGRSQFLIDLPILPEPSVAQRNTNTTLTLNNIQTVFGIAENYSHLISNASSFSIILSNLLQHFSVKLQEKILKIFKALVENIFGSASELWIIFHRLFPTSGDPYIFILKLIIKFLKRKMNEYEANYKRDKENAMKLPNYDEEEFNKTWGVHPHVYIRIIYWVECAADLVLGNKDVMRELVESIVQAVSKKICYYLDAEERRQNRIQFATQNRDKIQKTCRTCGGHYYTKRTFFF